MLDEKILDFQIAIFVGIGTFIFAIVCLKRRDLLKYLLSYIFLSLGTIFIYLQYFNYIYRLIGNIFFFFAAISIILSVYYDYYQIIIKRENKELLKHRIPLIILALTFITLTIIAIQIILIFLLSIAIVLMLLIFLKTKSPIHFAIFIFLVSSVLSLLSTVLNNFNVKGAWEFSYLTNIIYATIIITFPIIAFFEDRLIKSENRYKEAYDRASFYKDLVTHDINNVLQTIQTSTELISLYIKDPNKLEDAKKMNNIIKEQVNRGANLVINVLKLSELEEKEISLRLIDLCEILEVAIKYIIKGFPYKKINIKVEKTLNKKINVFANDLLLDVFENILINAAKHNKNQAIEILIKISVMQINAMNYFKLEFIDNGVGISEQMKEKIFQRAFQYTKKISGMGLGLSLVRKIIESYNGQIWVEDKIKGDHSKGSSFIVLIPETI